MQEKNIELLIDNLCEETKDMNYLIVLIEEMLIETREIKRDIDRFNKRLISIEDKQNKKNIHIISSVFLILFSEFIKYVLLKLDLK